MSNAHTHPPTRSQNRGAPGRPLVHLLGARPAPASSCVPVAQTVVAEPRAGNFKSVNHCGIQMEHGRATHRNFTQRQPCGGRRSFRVRQHQIELQCESVAPLSGIANEFVLRVITWLTGGSRRDMTRMVRGQFPRMCVPNGVLSTPRELLCCYLSTRQYFFNIF